ncbi:MAG TPA: thioredoxin domain-containing protein [Pyrinomonadaceae bacterium]|jgi:protein-disulfide isomerase|nr:thioredoxin domain-containing protein [Pyrinomonadaceae bacterium]
MRKFTHALALALALASAAAAQPGGATRQRPAAARPTPTPSAQTPARPAPTPAATPAPAAATAADPCGCEPVPLPAVVATVGAVKITPADFSEPTRRQIEMLKQQVVEARKNELNLQVNSILLEAEAKKRGVTTTKLIDDEVVAKTVNPTEAEARAYFEQNRARVEQQAGRRVEFDELKASVVEFMKGERQQQRALEYAQTLRAAHAVKMNVAEAAPPATPADRARVLAVVNGRNITSGDIEDSLRPLVYSVQEQIYALRQRDLDLRINDLLLEQEAQKRGVTSRALLETEVGGKVPVVTEAQAQEFYNQNKERVNGDFATLKYQIIDYLQEQERNKLNAALAERLRKATPVQTFLVAPEPPVYKIATDDQPSKGNQNASVTLVEFTDYQCPSCAAAHPVLERLMAEYGDRVHFVVRDFPLPNHADARKAAEAAEAAREQGKYWEYTALLFRNQSSLGVDNLKQYATSLGLDRAKFDAALDGGKFAPQVDRDLLDGQKIGVAGTPSIYINGRLSKVLTYEGLKAQLDAALKGPGRS